MKRFLTFAFTMLLAMSAHAQMMPDSTVQICAYWEKGDRIVYDCTKETIKVDLDGKETVTNASSETRVFEVIDQTDSSYILKTTYKDVFSPDAAIELNLAPELFNKLSESVTIYTRTDNLGSIQEVLNVDEVAENMKNVLPELFKNMTGEDAKTAESISMLLCTPQAVMMSCLEDVAPLFYFHGGRYSLLDEYATEEEVSNMYGGSPITTEKYFGVDEEESDEDIAVMYTYALADSDKVLPMVKTAAANILKATIPDGDFDAAYATIEKQLADNHTEIKIEVMTTTVIDLASGWPVCWFSDKVTTTTSDEGTTTITESQTVEISENQE